MFSGRPPGGYIVNINIVIISANITHILICLQSMVMYLIIFLYLN